MTSREKLNLLLSELNDEAFLPIALALTDSQTYSMGIHIWPDGLGGFTDRDKMEEIRKAAKEYVGGIISNI